MKIFALPLLLLCGLTLFAQIPDAPRAEPDRRLGQVPHSPEAKSELRNVIIANAAMYASSVVVAHATAYGSGQCYREDAQIGILNQFGRTGYAGGRLHPWRRSFTMTMPADSAIFLASYFLHKKRHNLLAVLLPSGSAAAQLGVAGMQYTQGCF